MEIKSFIKASLFIGLGGWGYFELLGVICKIILKSKGVL